MQNILGENRCGIYVQGSSGNEIYLNDFRNNKRSVSSSASSNTWNSTSMIVYNFAGNISTNYLGNFWSDYSVGNGRNMGIWDKPYLIGSDRDWHPLMSPFENYQNDQGNMSG
jgi:parallel beta-helix repeat protein